MARTTAGTLSSLRLHKKTGQSVVTLTNSRGSCRDYYLGKPGEDTKQRYQQLLAAWIAAGNEFPSQEASSEPDLPLTIRELTVCSRRSETDHLAALKLTQPRATATPPLALTPPAANGCT